MTDDAPGAARTGAGSAGGGLQVSFLGGFQVRVGPVSWGPRQLGGTKPRLIFEALLAHRGTPVSKDRLVSMLWDDSRGKGSRANLETYTCVLRKHLHALAPGTEDVIGSVAGSYAVDMSRVDLDLERHTSLIAAATDDRTSADEALPLLVEALALGDAALLPEEDDHEWLVDLRRLHAGRVRNQLVQGAAKVMDLAPSMSRHWCLLALDRDPLDEAAWITYLSSLEHLGFHAEGLRAYNDCRRVFARELGCSPGRVLRDTYVRLLRAANEDNDELSHLLDAVVSLHTVVGSTIDTTVAATAGGRAHRAAPAVSLEDARRSLYTLLTSANGTHIGGAAVARTA